MYILERTEDADQLTAESSLRALIQVWCLLVSADTWSRELKDVANEVVKTISELVHSMVSTIDIQASATRLVHTTIHLITMVAIDSSKQHILPASIKLISTVVKALLSTENYPENSHIRMTEVAYALVKICEMFLNRLVVFLITWY